MHVHCRLGHAQAQCSCTATGAGGRWPAPAGEPLRAPPQLPAGPFRGEAAGAPRGPRPPPSPASNPASGTAGRADPGRRSTAPSPPPREVRAAVAEASPCWRRVASCPVPGPATFRSRRQHDSSRLRLPQVTPRGLFRLVYGPPALEGG